MAAVSRYQAAMAAPLPLEATAMYEEYPTTRIKYTPPNESKPRKMRLPFASNASDKERIIRVLDEYQRSCDESSLHIHGKDRHTKAREVLCGDLSTSWDRTIVNASSTTDADFVTNARAFLKQYMLPNSFQIQEQYMYQITIPYSMDCFVASSRIQAINDLSVYLPGSGGKKLFQDDTSLKYALYRIMPSEWQMKFDATGNELGDPKYDLNRLVNYMEILRHHDDAVQGNHQQQCGPWDNQYNYSDGHFSDSYNQVDPYGHNDQFNSHTSHYDEEYDQSFDQYDDQYDYYDQHNHYDDNGHNNQY